MAKCRHCGADTGSGEARYCPRCGASLAAPTERPQIPTQLPDHMVVFLVYLVPILGPVIALNVAPYKGRQDIRFHAWQSLGLTGLWFAVDLALAILAVPFAFLAVAVLGLVGSVCHLALLGTWIYVLVSAWQRKELRLPYLADFADKQAKLK